MKHKLQASAEMVPGAKTDNNSARLDRRTPLAPANAVAALILVDEGYLLQLRDDKPGIFFPGQWGCFGGALEPGETEQDALARELREELAFEAAATQFSYFSRFIIDFGFAGHGNIARSFYEVRMKPAQLRSVRLNEGAAMQVFDAPALIAGKVPLTPFDSFALWLHVNRARLTR